jgi:predicted HicB family RNase H-like nuclease
MSNYKDVISQARKPASQQSGKPENQIATTATTAGTTTLKDEEVNLSIKVSKRRRQHWAAEAKRQGTSLTATVSEALSTRFGEPQM